jgi:fumarylacetoacetate (FAA) hydrolase family protein
MNLTEKGFNYKVVDIVEISNFGFGRFASVVV